MLKIRLPAVVISVLLFASVVVFVALYFGTDTFRASEDVTAASFEDYYKPEELDNPATENISTEDESDTLLIPSGKITFTDDTFAKLYDEIYDRRDSYYGREIDIAGFVMHEETEGMKNLLIGRNLLWCCEDDMFFIGFLVLTDHPYPEEDSSVRVKGTIKPAEYTNPDGKRLTVPAIKAESIHTAENVSPKVYRWFTK